MLKKIQCTQLTSESLELEEEEDSSFFALAELGCLVTLPFPMERLSGCFFEVSEAGGVESEDRFSSIFFELLSSMDLLDAGFPEIWDLFPDIEPLSHSESLESELSSFFFVSNSRSAKSKSFLGGKKSRATPPSVPPKVNISNFSLFYIRQIYFFHYLIVNSGFSLLLLSISLIDPKIMEDQTNDLYV